MPFFKATEDFYLRKIVNGVLTNLSTEAVDLSAKRVYLLKLSCNGTTISAYRDDMVTPKLTAIDTAIASGYFGVGGDASIVEIPGTLATAKLVAPSSVPPEALAYFEVPVIGDGSEEEPFRPQMPQEIVDGVNRLALSWSAVIKTGRDGKPTEYVAVVRILSQPYRQPNLRPIADCIAELKEMRGVIELKREEALKRAKELDDVLTDEDLREW